MDLTRSQKQRLNELGFRGKTPEFSSASERDKFFNELASKWKNQNKEKFRKLLEEKTPFWRQIEQKLRNILYELGFVEVQTPTIIPSSMLEKMGIDEKSDLYDQIYWVEGGKKALRPMLAPNLYRELRYFSRVSDEDMIRIFELGSCFRREEGGENYLNEFKMLNAVEMGNIDDTEKRLEELASLIFSPLTDYEIESEDSVVYGKTVDINVKGVEVASCVAGPHPLDSNWSIDDPWVGIGIGVERLAKLLDDGSSVRAYGKSFVYQGGVRLDIE